MPRQKITLSIAELIAELRRRQQKLPRLQKLAARLEKQLAGVRAEIAALGAPLASAKPAAKPGRKPGRPAGSKPAAKKPAKRARNKRTLAEAIIAVLDKETPKTVKAIIADVKASGYKTKSENFDTIVYQTLSRERKRVEKVGRGLYKLKA